MTTYYRRRMTSREAAGALVVAILAIGAAQSGTRTHHPEAEAAGIPTTAAGGGMTSAAWARDLLRSARLPVTSCGLGAIEAWIGAEGSDPAWRNLLDTTQPEPGSYPVNSAGVQAYTSWHQGFAATVATLDNGRYGAILSALRSGRSAQAVADAVTSSPWGTERFGASC